MGVNIAIIGTPGAGKTVFISVLAMRYRAPAPGKPWLSYNNRETQRYVTRVWDTLQKEEWPISTPPGEFSALDWCLHTSTGEQHSLLVRDPAGQDVRAIYDSPEEEHTDDQRELKRIFDAADIMLFLVNLRPAMDAGSSQAKIDDIEIPLTMAIRDALEHRRRVAILATQHDIIANSLENIGAQEASSAQAAITRFLPQVGGLLESHPESIGTFFVAAVADTVPVVEDGKPYRRPLAGFSSQGLDEVLRWVEKEVPEAADARARRDEERSIEAAREAAVRERMERVEAASQLRPRFFVMTNSALGGLAVAVFAFLFVRSKTFDQLYKSYYDAAVVQKMVPVQKEEQTMALPSSEYELESLTYEYSSGDQYRNIVFKNKSNTRLYSLTIYFAWETSFWGTHKSAETRIASIEPGESVRRNNVVYCDGVEWRNMRYQVACYYKVTVQESQWVHDPTKDDEITARARREAMNWGFLGAAVGLVPCAAFGVAAARVRNQMQNILASGKLPALT